jgi:hypothetical protein
MQRETWTDQRMDEMSRHVDQRFDQVDQRFDRVEWQVRDLRTEMRSDIAELRMLIFRFGLGTIGTVLVAVLLRAF